MRVVDLRSMSVVFCDKPRSISGEERLIIPDGLLQCSSEASSKEVIDTVTRIVEEVADEYGANSAVALSKAKARVSEAADEEEYLAPWDMAADVFEDEPLQKRFEEAVAEEQLPERIPVLRRKSPSAWRKTIRSNGYGHRRNDVPLGIQQQLRVHRIRQRA